MTDNKYLTVKETAKYLNRSRSNVYDMINNNEIPAKKLGGKYIIKKEKLDKIIEE